LTGAVEGDSGPCFSLRMYCGMRGDFSEVESCGVEGEILMLGLADRFWVGGAAVHGSFEVVLLGESGGLGVAHHGCAVMDCLSAAAGWEQRCYVGAERQQRRDQREADEEHEQDGERTPHGASLSDVRLGWLIGDGGLNYLLKDL
jgi:hypothetical protein